MPLKPFYSVPINHKAKNINFWEPVIDDLNNEEKIQTIAYKSLENSGIHCN